MKGLFPFPTLHFKESLIVAPIVIKAFVFLFAYFLQEWHKCVPDFVPAAQTITAQEHKEEQTKFLRKNSENKIVTRKQEFLLFSKLKWEDLIEWTLINPNPIRLYHIHSLYISLILNIFLNSFFGITLLRSSFSIHN
eukprot:GHVR01160322.1.p1 GENE.GHVR01160322.1~~GHVR01160322.1.p1  ORF type:complete len:137 (+),score=4.37 GHVR01160322.1:474-884(+)